MINNFFDRMELARRSTFGESVNSIALFFIVVTLMVLFSGADPILFAFTSLTIAITLLAAILLYISDGIFEVIFRWWSNNHKWGNDD